MKQPVFLLLLFCLLIVHCAPDKRSAGSSVRGEVNESVRLAEDVNSPTYPGPSAPATTVRIGGGQVARGGEICVPLQAYDFRDMLAFQYSVQWDSTVLEFIRLQNFGLPSYGLGNFNTLQSSNGRLSTVWTEPGVQPYSLDDGSTLYEICFKAIGQRGSQSLVRIGKVPTPVEFTNESMKPMRLRFANGEVLIE